MKAINDLRHPLKESRNTKGILQIEALLKIDELFNKQLTSTAETKETTQEIQPSPRLTFAESSNPPQEIPTPRVAIEKMPNPRVAIKKATIDKAISDDLPNYTPRELGAELNHLIRLAANNRARIQNCHQMNLRRQDRNKKAQLIHNNKTGEYLNYQQLIQDPKHRETWERSTANKFGRLAQGLKDGRVTGTNTIHFIHKDKVPNERRKDVTYGSFS